MPERYSKAPRDTRCITCEYFRQQKRAPLRMASVAFVVLILVSAFGSARTDLLGVLVIGAVTICILLPLSILLHELGHAVSARLLGLEVGGIVVGSGRTIWSGEFRGVPLQLHSAPILGRTYLGFERATWPRLRIWIATLMGPATNAVIVYVCMVYWDSLSRVIDPSILTIWVIMNALDAAGNLLPFSFEEFGQQYRSDGLALLQIPRMPSETLEEYTIASPLVRALLRFERRDFPGAQRACMDGLARKPDNGLLRVTLAACLIHLKECAAAREVLEPLLGANSRDPPIVGALARNDAAVALFLSKRDAGDEQAAAREADSLSRQALEAFPCLLSVRSTRALVLVWCGQPGEALQLLDYSNYANGSRQERGDRAAAQCLAFRAAGRTEEAEAALAVARQVHPATLEFLGLT